MSTKPTEVSDTTAYYAAQAAQPDVPPAHKRTEVGGILEDWDVCTLRDDITLLSGHHVLAQYCNTSGYGVPYLTGPADFQEGKIQQSKFTTRPTTLCESGDILVTVKGSGSGTLIVADGSYCISRQLMAIRVREWDGEFMFYSLLQNASKIKAASTGLIPGLSRLDILEQEIPIPASKTEQRAIAAALSDVDDLITAMDKLIAKKRAIKTAAMQQLLTGKQRLPGFGGEWAVKKLGGISASITTGKLDANAMKPDGEYRFYTCAKEHYRINEYAFDAEALLVSGNGANVGYIHYYKGKFNAYQRTYVLTEFSGNIHFIKLFLERNLAERIRIKVNAGNTPYITMDTLTDMEVFLPQTIEEQTAIATTLSDMDREITALEARHDKTRAIKQGMMQELLTGRTWLI